MPLYLNGKLVNYIGLGKEKDLNNLENETDKSIIKDITGMSIGNEKDNKIIPIGNVFYYIKNK